MKRRIIKLIAVILAALILCLAPVIVSEYAKHQPITIKTALTDSEVVPHVKLSNGELWFKTEDDIYAQFTQEDYTFTTKIQDYYYGDEVYVPYYQLNGGKIILENEMAAAMNIHPECWKVPNNMLSDWKVDYLEPYFALGESDKLFFYEIGGGYLYNFKYSLGRLDIYSDGIDIYIGPPTQKWLPSSQITTNLYWMDGFGLSRIRNYFGDMDSYIGDTAISVRQSYGHFYAFMTVGNASYQISVNRDVMSQSEFIELLISICEAPRENTQDVVEYILEHG